MHLNEAALWIVTGIVLASVIALLAATIVWIVRDNPPSDDSS